MPVSIEDTGKGCFCSDWLPVIGRPLFPPVFIIRNIVKADIGCQDIMFSPIVIERILRQKICKILQFLRRTDLVRCTLTSISTRECRGCLTIYCLPNLPMLMLVFLQDTFFLHRIICFDKSSCRRSQNAEAKHCCYPFLFHFLLLVGHIL